MQYFLSAILFILLYISIESRVIIPYISKFEQEVELFKGKELWFPDDNGNPVQAILEPVPELELLSDMEKVITFKLYTRWNGNRYDILKVNDKTSLAESQFDPRKPTRFFAHGWTATSDGSSSTKIRKAYLRREDCNVIVIDWSRISLGLYTVARIYAPLMADHVASMMDFLAEHGMDMNTTTVIGHSLGAHLMGLAGYRAKNKVNFAVGLDPAWPLFGLCNSDCRISSESAKIVEIVHTNGGFLGNPFAIGDLDFYPNGGGKKQPGCKLDPFGACAHSRSVEFYAESILTKTGFYGIKCKSIKLDNCDGKLELMGDSDLITKEPGIYYLETRDQAPFAMGNIFDESNYSSLYIFD